MTVQIGFDATPLVGERSGVGNYTGHLLAALLVHNPHWQHNLYSNQPLHNLEPELQRAIPVAGYFPHSRWLWMQTILPRMIYRSQPDLCHFTNASAPLWQPRPFVLTIYDASLFLHQQHHPWSRLVAMRLLLPTLARRAEAVITISEFARRDLIHLLRLPPEKVHVVYGAAAQTFAPVQDPRQRQDLRRKYRLPQEFLLYVGTVEPRKNLLRLIQAFARLRRRKPSARLVLAGAYGWMMDGFTAEIARLGLKEAIQLLGYVPKADLPGLYSLATAFVFPSLYEGFGLPPLEAMACGTPVLTSSHSAMAEVCGTAAYMVDPRDEEALAEGLWQLLTNEACRAELRVKGLARAADFSWQRAAAETTAVYKKVLRLL